MSTTAAFIISEADSDHLSTCPPPKSPKSPTTSSPTPSPPIHHLSLKDLFIGIDFKTTNLGKLEKEWKKELEEIEINNIKSLISSSKTNVDNEALKSILQISSSLSSKALQINKYVVHLQSMEAEITQIQQINQGLSIQCQNQIRLLSLLERVFENLNFISDEQLWMLEQCNFSSLLLDKENLKEISNISILLSDGIKKCQQFLEEEGLLALNAAEERLIYLSDYQESFIERLFAFLKSFFEIQSKNPSPSSSSSLMECDNGVLTSLVGNADLVIVLRKMSLKKSDLLLGGIQEILSKICKNELETFLRCLKKMHLYHSQEDPYKMYLFQTPPPPPYSLLKSSKGTPFIKCDYSEIPLNSYIEGDLEFMVPIPPPSSLLTCYQLLNYILISIASLRRKEEVIFGKYFFDSNEPPSPPPSTQKSLTSTQKSLTTTIWSMAPSILFDWIKEISLQDPLIIIECLLVIEERITTTTTTTNDDDDFIIIELHEKIFTLMVEFFDVQLRSLKNSKNGFGGNGEKRIGVFEGFKKFTKFISLLSEKFLLLKGKHNHLLMANTMMDTINEKVLLIHENLFLKLDLMISDALKSGDEKMIQNAGVMAIQNTNFLITSSILLENVVLICVKEIIKRSTSRLQDDLQSYSIYSMTRVAPKLIDFFNSFEREISKKSSSSLRDISFNANFSLQIVKSTLLIYNKKEMKKRLALVYERIEKHFSDDKFLTQMVWKSLMSYMLQKHLLWNTNLRKVYVGGGAEQIQLPWSEDEIREIFDFIHR